MTSGFIFTRHDHPTPPSDVWRYRFKHPEVAKTFDQGDGEQYRTFESITLPCWPSIRFATFLAASGTVKRAGTGLRALDHDRAFPGFTLFAPMSGGGNVYLIDLDAHAPTPLANGNLLLFDNGPHRLDHPMPFSRVIEVERSTMKIVWEYREKRERISSVRGYQMHSGYRTAIR